MGNWDYLCGVIILFVTARAHLVVVFNKFICLALGGGGGGGGDGGGGEDGGGGDNMRWTGAFQPGSRMEAWAHARGEWRKKSGGRFRESIVPIGWFLFGNP